MRVGCAKENRAKSQGVGGLREGTRVVASLESGQNPSLLEKNNNGGKMASNVQP